MLFFSTLHGRERRALRGIDRIDLQAAVLHRTKEKGWPHPVTGAARLKYTHAGIVYITDESSTVEITSYAVPIDIPHADLTPTHVREHEAAKRRLRIDASLCTSHTVIVVDQSASMKTCDIFDFRNRSMAVFGTLALDFVAKQRVSGEGTDTDVVSLVAMRDEGEVVFEREPMGLVLYNRLVTTTARRGPMETFYRPWTKRNGSFRPKPMAVARCPYSSFLTADPATSTQRSPTAASPTMRS